MSRREFRLGGFPRDEQRHPHAIDEIRHMVGNLNRCSETFNQRWDTAQLLQLHRAWLASGWDFSPDTWTERQVREALMGRVPTWSDDELPTYAPRKVKS